MSNFAKTICIVLLFAVTVSAQEISAVKLSDDVLVVSGGGGNITVIKTSDGLLVVDTFISPKLATEAKKLIEQHFPDQPVRFVVNTHYHWDHTFGNQVFSDALIIAHINDSDRVRKDYAERVAEIHSSGDRIKELEAQLSQPAGLSADKATEIKKELETLRQTQEQYGNFVLTPASMSLDGSARLEHGGKTFWLLHFGPGHTDGDLVILDVQDRVLIMGDLVFNHMFPYIDINAGADIQNWLSTLQKLIDRSGEYDHVVPGHGDTGDVQVLKDMKSQLVDLWQAVADARKQGLTLQQAKEKITLDQYKDYGRQDSLQENIEACWLMKDKK